MTKPKTSVKRVSVIFYNSEYRIEYPDGLISIKIAPEHVIEEIQAFQRIRAKKYKTIEIWVIDWFNMPVDFVPPKGK